MTRNLPIIICILLLTLLGSCEHKELCYHHEHLCRIYVEFDWRDAPQANPSGMTVYFYPIDNDGKQSKSPYRFDFIGGTGGEIEVPQGRYHAICYNNDSEVIQFRQTANLLSHYATTRTGALFEPLFGSGASSSGPRAEGSEDEKIFITPDQLTACTALDIEINPSGITYFCQSEAEKKSGLGTPTFNENQILVFYPHDLLCYYTFEIINIKNLESIKQMTASLTAMSSGVELFGENLGKECVTIPFPAYKEGNDRITGSFYTFGHHEDNDRAHRLLLYVWLTNGQKIYFGASSPRFNVTEQIHSSPDRRRVHIVINGLDVPDPMGDGPGFDPSADDWQDEDHEIELTPKN